MVQKVRINSSNELYDNKSDESRVYDIMANANIASGTVNNIDSGSVYKDGTQVANFNSWEQNHLNVTYIGVELDEQNSINAAVNAFISEVKEAVSNSI